MNDPYDNFVFIGAWQGGKPTPDDQKLIRSRSKPKKYRRKVVKESGTKWISYSDTLSHAAQSLILSNPVSPELRRSAAPSRRKARQASCLVQQYQQECSSTGTESLSISKKAITSLYRDFPLWQFAGDLGPQSIAILRSVYPGFQRAFSVQNFGVTTKLHSSQWWDWLLSDVAYLHAILAAVSAVQDGLMRRKTSKLTHLHLSKAVGELQENINTGSSSITDVTVAGIISLYITSFVSLDKAAMVVHGKGLAEIVRLRGGLESFRFDSQFMFLMTRIDLFHCLVLGQIPLFRYSNTLPSPKFNNPGEPLFSFDGIAQIMIITRYVQSVADPRVASIFEFLQYLGRSTDATVSGAQIITESDLHRGITAVQYRLLELQGDLPDIISECLRMAMLAFLTTTFQLMGMRIRYGYAAERLRELCLGVESSTPQMRELMLWVLMIGTVAFFDHEEPWIREKWRLDIFPITKELQWDQTRRLLERYIWVDRFNAIRGQYVYDKLNRMVYE
ncbi:hypothetical protein BX600DRAFT_464892 [Xylariales sp. PMI_506]|nr:hypothetical protein BX600DRAFT_464892 [Xylariales sp. PMI_506]